MLSPVLKNQLPGIDPSHQELKAGPLPENHQHLLSLLKFQRVHEKEPGQLTVTHSGENHSILISQRVHINISKGLNSSQDGSKIGTSREGFNTNQGTIASKEETFPTQSDEKGSKELYTPTMLQSVLWEKQSKILNTASLESALLSGEIQGIRIEDETKASLVGSDFVREGLQILTDSKTDANFPGGLMPLTHLRRKAKGGGDSEFKSSKLPGFILKQYESIARKIDINSFDLSNTISPVGYTDIGSLPPPERRQYGSNRRTAVTPHTLGQLSHLQRRVAAPIGGVAIETGELHRPDYDSPERSLDNLDLAQIEYDPNIKRTFRAFLSLNEAQSYQRTHLLNTKYNKALAAAMDENGWATATRAFKKQ
jgi:hypothetical protein